MKLLAFTIAILMLLWFTSCAIPPSPNVQAHAAGMESARMMGVQTQVANTFWK